MNADWINGDVYMHEESKSESINRMATAKLISMNDADDASVRSNCGCACTRTRAHSQSGADQTRSDQANPTQANPGQS